MGLGLMGLVWWGVVIGFDGVGELFGESVEGLVRKWWIAWRV